jgi:peptidoglycan hydrolase-like protein with peptidoglycan-binding domain
MLALLGYLPLILQFVQLISQIKSAWDSSPTNSLGKIDAVLTGTQLVPQLEQMGAQLFPKLAPSFHAAAAALVVAHPDATSWLQAALNAVDKAGLAVDGHYGPKTRAAVEAFQTKHGLAVTGFASDLENSAIMAALAALGG